MDTCLVPCDLYHMVGELVGSPRKSAPSPCNPLRARGSPRKSEEVRAKRVQPLARPRKSEEVRGSPCMFDVICLAVDRRVSSYVPDLPPVVVESWTGLMLGMFFVCDETQNSQE